MNIESVSAEVPQIFDDAVRAKTIPLDARHVHRVQLSPAQAEQTATSLTVRAWGARWLERREREGLRLAKDDRRIWATHVLCEPWADWPLSHVTKAVAREWWSQLHSKCSSNPTYKEATRRAKPLSAATMRNIRQCVRKAFADAVEEELIARNYFSGLTVNRSKRATTTRARVPVLYPEEQAPALELFAELVERWIVRFALFSGVRQGEQWTLHLSDVDMTSLPPTIFVRFGGSEWNEDGTLRSFEPTKSGTPRRLYLNESAAEALREWLLVLPIYAPSNPHGLVFPRRDGRARRKGRVFRSFKRIARLLGRPFTWHGLRHSCGSSLVGGWWGETWTVAEVKEYFDHSQISVTEKYVHIAANVLRRRAARTSGLGSVPHGVQEKMNTEKKEPAAVVDGANGAAVEAAPEGLIAQSVELRTFKPEATSTKVHYLTPTERAVLEEAMRAAETPGVADLLAELQASARALASLDAQKEGRESIHLAITGARNRLVVAALAYGNVANVARGGGESRAARLDPFDPPPQESDPRGSEPLWESLAGFVRWIAEHPDVGCAMTAAEREMRFQREARKVLDREAPGWEARAPQRRQKPAIDVLRSLVDQIAKYRIRWHGVGGNLDYLRGLAYCEDLVDGLIRDELDEQRCAEPLPAAAIDRERDPLRGSDTKPSRGAGSEAQSDGSAKADVDEVDRVERSASHAASVAPLSFIRRELVTGEWVQVSWRAPFFAGVFGEVRAVSRGRVNLKNDAGTSFWVTEEDVSPVDAERPTFRSGSPVDDAFAKLAQKLGAVATERNAALRERDDARARLRVAVGLLSDVETAMRGVSAFLDAEVKR